MGLKEVFANSRNAFIFSILLGFLLPQFSNMVSLFILPILIVMMTISVKNITLSYHKGHSKKTIVLLLLTNYVLLTGSFLLITRFFIPEEFRPALYLYALMPPAVGIIPLTYILHGDLQISFITEFLGYLLAIVIIPVGSLLLFGSSVPLWDVLRVVLYLILLPFIASRIIRWLEKRSTKEIDATSSKIIINICYALTFYAIIGVNRDFIIENFMILLPIFVLSIVIRFGLGNALYIGLQKFVKKPVDILFLLFSTFKNGSAAIAFTILLFGIEATVPLAAISIISPFHILFLEQFILGKME